MDFGRLDSVDGMEFHLPPDAELTHFALKGKPVAAPLIRVGCPSYNHPEWLGKAYPAKTKQADFLKVYLRQFQSIEMNSTAYAMPTPAQVSKWHDLAAEVNPAFRYCPKLPQTVTHYGRLEDRGPLVDEFVQRMLPLRPFLGPALFQLSERVGPKHWPALKALLQRFPPDFQLAVELRHPDWFLPGAPEWAEELAAMGIGTAITDTAGKRNVLHMKLSTPVAFIRFTGNNLHATDFSRLQDWAARTRQWLDRGLEALYFMVHTPDKTYCPELYNDFAERLSAVAGLKLPLWKQDGQTNTLF